MTTFLIKLISASDTSALQSFSLRTGGRKVCIDDITYAASRSLKKQLFSDVVQGKCL